MEKIPLIKSRENDHFSTFTPFFTCPSPKFGTSTHLKITVLRTELSLHEVLFRHLEFCGFWKHLKITYFYKHFDNY